MKVIQIIQSKEHYLTIFWISERIGRTNRLRGINYNCGTDIKDSYFAVVDEKLTKIYTNRYMHDLNADKVDIAIDSIYEKINKDKEEYKKIQFEKSFHNFLQEQREEIDFTNKIDRDIISSVVNKFLDNIDIE